MEKTRFALWISEDALQRVQEKYQADNCRTQSDFITKAIHFYSDYLESEQLSDYLPQVLSSVLSGQAGQIVDRLAKLLFKQSVELSMLTHLIAADTDIDAAALERLRVRCVNDVKKTNGMISFRDILNFQKEL